VLENFKEWKRHIEEWAKIPVITAKTT